MAGIHNALIGAGAAGGPLLAFGNGNDFSIFSSAEAVSFVFNADGSISYVVPVGSSVPGTPPLSWATGVPIADGGLAEISIETTAVTFSAANSGSKTLVFAGVAMSQTAPSTSLWYPLNTARTFLVETTAEESASVSFVVRIRRLTSPGIQIARSGSITTQGDSL